MKLPRRPIGGSVVSELHSQRAGAISPGEAAAAEIAKFGAMAAVTDMASKVASLEASARAEEEYTDAVYDYETNMLEYDVEQETREFELDENDNVVVDDVQLVEEEFKHRKDRAGKAREKMTSAAGKRNFDRYLSQSNLKRNAEYKTRAAERRINILGAQATHKVGTLILRGQFDAAYERGKIALGNGVIGQKEFDSMRILINRSRSTSRINDALLGDSTRNELYELLEVLEKDEFPGGKKTMLSSDERYSYSNRLNTKLANLDKIASESADSEREQAYLKYLVPVVNGKMSVDEVRTKRGELDKTRFDKLIGFAITSSRRPRESDQDVLETYERRVIELRIGRGYDPQYVGYKDTIDDMIEAMSLDAGMAVSDINRLITDLDSYTKAIRDNPDLEDILNVELTKITGRKVDQFAVMFEGQDKSHLVEAQRLERDFKRAMLQAGPDDVVFNGEKWMHENVGRYHMKIQTKMLKDYDILGAPTNPDGSLNTDKLATMMLEYQIKSAGANQTGQGMTTSEAKQQAMYDYDMYMRLVEAG